MADTNAQGQTVALTRFTFRPSFSSSDATLGAEHPAHAGEPPLPSPTLPLTETASASAALLRDAHDDRLDESTERAQIATV